MKKPMTKAEFDALPIREQRIKIAEDVIAGINTRFSPLSTYLEPTTVDLGSADPDRQLCEVLAKDKCHVCGIGALFICAVDRHDSLTVGQWLSDSDIRSSSEAITEYLEPWFKPEIVEEIECAFEGYDEFEELLDDGDDTKWGKTAPADRLRIIAQNIIDNKGTFKGKRIIKQYVVAA